jgi:hypothetical protein
VLIERLVHPQVSWVSGRPNAGIVVVVGGIDDW